MRRDPTEFRKRFQQWKAGEKVYEAGLPKYELGKDSYGMTPHKASSVNLNLASYNDRQDIYEPKYTLPEVVITGQKPLYKPGPKFKGFGNYSDLPHESAVTFKDVSDVMNTVGGGIVPMVSDVGDVADVANDVQNKNYGSATIGVGLLALPNVLEKPLRGFGRFVKNIFKREKPIKTATDWLSEVTDEEIAEYIKNNPYHLDDNSWFSWKAENMPSGLNIRGLNSREDAARLQVARQHYKEQNPEVFQDDIFKGYAPLDNFMARNNLTLNDLLAREVSFEQELDFQLMKEPSQTKINNLLDLGIEDAFYDAGGKHFSEDAVDDLVYNMAKGDPFALRVRDKMIQNYEHGVYNRERKKVMVGNSKYRRTKADGVTVMPVEEQVIRGHEHGHFLFDEQDTRSAIKEEVDKIRETLKSQRLSSSVADVTGFDPFLTVHGQYFLGDWFNEIVQRVSQWKDALGIRNNTTQLTGDDVRKMMKTYVKQSGIDNNMTDMINSIVDPDKFAKFFSKYAKIIVPTAVVTGASTQALTHASNDNELHKYKLGKDGTIHTWK